jgi:hypothetical protein
MASAQEHGFLQIQKYNQGSKQRIPLKEQRTEILGYVAPASRTNPQEQDETLQFLEGGLAVDEKELLEVWFTGDSVDIIESEESKLHIDVTIVDKKTGRELPSALTFENFTGFTSAGTVDITCPASSPVRVAYYEVPTGQQLVLGRKDGRGKIYAYIGDDTA